nr:AAA family ATPase [bacterium]
MRLKTLEMSGFKSFVDRTIVQFEDGITGVVGPNGCGKSNIVDAIRWVMGEMSAKHLRGSEMSDVIFNGCDTRPPTGMAQVFLTFDNSDGRAPAEYANYSEIQIGRRLYRSGESEYFLNKTPCRLKDIIDIFLGTGVGTKAYSIVEQGMVGHIVSAKPEERRMLIEEAAGISKFKARKEAALRKMESTRSNLARLGDILGELTRQINSLNRQAKKAERFQRVSDELKVRELALAATKHRVMSAELSKLSDENDRLKEIETSSSAELSGYEAELEAKRLSLAGVQAELDGVQQDLYRAQHSIQLAEAEIAHKMNERASVSEQAAQCAKDLESLKERRRSLEEQIENANAALALADLKLAGSSDVAGALESEVGELRRRVEGMKERRDELKGQAMGDDAAIANGNATMEHLERRHIDLTGRIARDQAEIDAIDVRRKALSEEISRHERDLDGSHQLKLKLSEESESALAALVAQRSMLEEAESKLAALREEVSGKRQRLASLKDLRKNLEGYRDGVRAVLSRADEHGEKLEGVLGTVSEFVETEAEYEAALGA